MMHTHIIVGSIVLLLCFLGWIAISAGEQTQILQLQGIRGERGPKGDPGPGGQKGERGEPAR